MHKLCTSMHYYFHLYVVNVVVLILLFNTQSVYPLGIEYTSFQQSRSISFLKMLVTTQQ